MNDKNDFSINKKLEINFLGSDNVLSINTRNINGHKNTICSKCYSNYTSGNWHKRYDENKIWDGTYICTTCNQNPAYRLEELNPNSNTYKGILGEQIKAKILGYENCILMPHNSPFDIYTKKDVNNKKYGYIEIKISEYHPKYRRWHASNIKPWLFDTLSIICTSEEFENIERVYEIPGYDVNVTSISIYKNPLRGDLYEEFRVGDIKSYQEAFETVKNEIQISKNYVDNDENLLNNNKKGNLLKKIIEKTIEVEISIYIDYDLIHNEYKRIKVKGSSYYSRRKIWIVSGIKSFKFDTLFIVCMSGNFEKVERVYIIPKKDVDNRIGITILKNFPANAWYNKFRVNEKPYQKTYEKILKGEI